MVFFFGFFREEDRVGRIEIIKSEKTQERGSEGRVHPGHETESGVEEDDEEELLVGRRATQSQQREKSERDKDVQAGVGVETQTQRNKEIRRTRDWKRRLHSGAALFLLYWRGGCQKPGEVGFLTNTHTHTLTVSYTPHLNVPRGALVLPLSSIWETVQGPGERERLSAGMLRSPCVTGKEKKKRKKKDDINQTQTADRIMGCFHTNIWDCVALYSELYHADWQAYIVHNITQQCFLFKQGRNCIRVTGGKDADGAGPDSRITCSSRLASDSTLYTLFSSQPMDTCE